ncbi:hypothetical protein [Seinonella peptonophila]|uniref:hypothetical protein n=1 Tax=Seinonella peptonophila TaxID=112248 RepID=UPI0015877B20|nr:hypothetical protein [Seinonella peptonophila]
MLRILGAFDENNQITEIGQAMAQLPISVRNARMIIEAQRLDVIQELVTITATFIRGHLGAPSGGWKQLVSTERESDFVTQLLLEEKTRGMTHSQRVEMGINAKRFSLVQKTRRRLLRELYLNPTENSVYSEQKRGRIIQACLAGLVDHIFWKSGESQQSLYTDRSGRIYTLDSQSIVKDADLIVGWPTAVQRPSGEIIRTIYMATKADPSWIDPVTSRIVVERINPHTQPIQPQSVPTAMFIEPSYRQSETGIEEKGRRKPSQRAESQSTNPSSQTDDGPVSQAALEALLRKFNRRV